MHRMNPTIQAGLSGFTSDHAWRGISAHFRNAGHTVDITLRGATWNMLNRAHDENKLDSQGVPCGYSNNPFKATETLDEYKARKIAQVRELEIMLDSQQGKPLDFIFLQEVDWAQHSSDKDERAVRQEIQAMIEKMLQRRGYALEITKHKKSDLPANITQQALVTIYNTQTLRHQQSIGAFLLDNKRFRGYESQFTHRASNEKITLTNLHLDFDRNYVDEIDTYLAAKVTASEHTVLGGDTNHPQNEGLKHLIVDWHAASNIDDDNGLLTDLDRRDKNKKKAYDGFFAAPGGSDFYVQVSEEQGKYFTIENGHRSAVARPYMPVEAHRHHLSEPGQPWMRTRYMLEKLDRQLGIETDPAKEAKLITEMKSLIVRRLPGKKLEDFPELVNANLCQPGFASSGGMFARGGASSSTGATSSRMQARKK